MDALVGVVAGSVDCPVTIEIGVEGDGEHAGEGWRGGIGRQPLKGVPGIIRPVHPAVGIAEQDILVLFVVG
ncbi:hypothetical protein ES703_91986 [subsurface metagenome]